MKKIISFAMVLCLLLLAACSVSYGCSVKAVEYPDEAIFSPAIIDEYVKRAVVDTSYEQNRGYDETSLLHSPYYTAVACGTDLPVYSTLTYSSERGGMLHSFTTLLVTLDKNGDVNIPFFAKTNFYVRGVSLFSENSYEKISFTNESISAVFTDCGVYTFVLNGNQQYALTVYVKPAIDENAEIAEYKKDFGEENVTVFERGFYDVNCIDVKSNSVIYLKSGAYLSAEKPFDVMSADDERANSDGGSISPVKGFFELNRADNVVIKGNGIVDFVKHDWHSRQAFTAYICNNIELSDVIFLNSSNWNIVMYRCNDVKISGISAYGFKTNSDGVNICNTEDAEITDCLVRAGDDAFSVKTLGSQNGTQSKNITFERCYAWCGKARAFGITGEVEAEIDGITFKNSVVLFRDASWSESRLGSLVVIVENGGKAVKNVFFENIEINYDASFPVNISVANEDLTGFTAENIVFKNIHISASGKLRMRAENTSNSISAIFENVIKRTKEITAENLSNYVELDEFSSVVFR